MTTPAGWYADPSDSTAQRWWSGVAWTEHVAHAAPVAASAAAPAPAYFPAAVFAGASSGAPVFGGVQPYSMNGAVAAGGGGYTYPPAGGAPGLVAGDFPDPRYMKRGAREKYLRRVNPVAYAGLLVALLGMILNFWGLAEIAAIILSSIGLARAARLRGVGHLITGRGYSIAGLVIGIVAWIVQAGVLVAAIVNSAGFQAGLHSGVSGR